MSDPNAYDRALRRIREAVLSAGGRKEVTVDAADLERLLELYDEA